MRHLLFLLSLIALSSFAETSRYVDAPELQTKDRAAINQNFQNIDNEINKVMADVKKEKRNSPYINVKNYGAVGDGYADDSSALNAALSSVGASGGTVYIPSGTYMASDPIIVRTGTRLIGDGANGTILKASASLGDTEPLLRNFTISGSADTYYDKDIRVEGITFDGNNIGGGGASRTRNTELISISKAMRVFFSECLIMNHQYVGIAFGGNKMVRMRDCELTEIGDKTPSALSGPSVWAGQTGDGSYNYDMVFDGINIHDTEEAAYSINAKGWRISGGEIKNVKECGVFLGPNNSGARILGVRVYGVTKMWISSSGMEIGGGDVVIAGCDIEDTEADSISITDAQGVIVSGNTFSTPRQNAVSFPQAAPINIITTASAGSQPRGINITGNVVLTGTPYAFVGIGNSGSPVEHVLIEGNTMNGITFTSGSPWNFDMTKVGSNVVVKNNLGAGMNPVVGEVQTRSGTGTQVITGVGFMPRRIDIEVVKGSSAVVEKCSSVTTWNEYDGSASATCHYHATDGTNNIASTGGSNAINLVSPSGTSDITATISSRSNDGFTLTFTVAGFQGWMRYVCYP